MFTYFYRILDRFNKEVASIAIFTDNDPNYQPDKYEYHSLDTSNIFRFKTYKIKGLDIAALENSNNPFAMVVLTALIALKEPDMRPEDLLDLSFELARRMLRKGFPKEKINRLLVFLRSYVYLDDIIELVNQLLEERGMQRGAEIAKTSVVTNLLQKTDFSLKEIAELTEVSIDFVIDVKVSLSFASPLRAVL
jgi:hypothetical protein